MQCCGENKLTPAGQTTVLYFKNEASPKLLQHDCWCKLHFWRLKDLNTAAISGISPVRSLLFWTLLNQQNHNTIYSEFCGGGDPSLVGLFLPDDYSIGGQSWNYAGISLELHSSRYSLCPVVIIIIYIYIIFFDLCIDHLFPFNSSSDHWDIPGMLSVSLYHQQPIWDGVMIHRYISLLFPLGCSL